MEIDVGTSSASNDSNGDNFAHSLSANLNYYTDNLFFATNGKLDAYFSNDKLLRKTVDSKRIDYYNNNKQKDSFCALSKSASVKGGDGDKRGAGFGDEYDLRRAIIEDSGASKKGGDLDFFSSNCKKNSMENSIHLHNVDSYGKKSVGFSPDQVIIN